MRLIGGDIVMNNVCKICNEEFAANNHFWRAHGIKESEYYVKYIPRFSKHTGEPIRFKNRDFYLNSDFNDKTEMKQWLNNNPEEAKVYMVELLKKRKEQKDLKYTLSEVELRSLGLPSVAWYKKAFGDYNKLAKSIGFKKRFNYPDALNYIWKDFTKEVVFVDTREQTPLTFDNVPTEKKTLSYGDYTLSNNSGIYIERKTLSDFVNTVGPNIERFCKEIERAKKDKAYLVVLIESPLIQALSFNYLPHMRFATKSTPDFVFHNVRKLMQTYKNIQFVFVNGRRMASETIIKIYYHSHLIKNLDLQYCYDKHMIK